MKIIHVIPSLQSGGAERLVIDIVTTLSSMEGINARLIILKDNIEHDVSSVEKYMAIIPSSIKLSPYKPNIFYFENLQKFIDDFDPDVIHTHLYEAEIVCKSLHFPKAKWFCHFHDNMPQLLNFGLPTLFNKQKLLNFYEKSYLKRRNRINGPTHFIAISRHTLAYAKNVIGNQNKVSYLKNAIAFDNYYQPIREIVTGSTLRLINVGSFQAKKNQQFLIDVLEVLVNQSIDVQLDLLGDGECRQAVFEKAEKKGLADFVRFHGKVKHVNNYLADADIYVHSAYYEPFGLVILEAMAAGLPVVSINGGGNQDITTHGKDGFILENQDAKQFADCIMQLFQKKERYLEIAKNGQLRAMSFDIKAYCRNLLDLYKLPKALG